VILERRFTTRLARVCTIWWILLDSIVRENELFESYMYIYIYLVVAYIP
jgi:hypothetical protein